MMRPLFVISVVGLVTLGLSAPEEAQAKVRCGDGRIGGHEECDGRDFGNRSCADFGYDAGDLNCTHSCTVDTSRCYNDDPCGNGAIDRGEVCDGDNVGGRTCQDYGYDNGRVGCADSCAEFDTSGCYNDDPPDDTCGNGVVDDGEECDGNDLDNKTCGDYGHMGGDLKCGSDCMYDFSDCNDCGDGRVQPGEECDGGDLMGASCRSEGYEGGEISCNGSCMLDTSMCEGGGGSCGNGVAEENESCDGRDLAGESCESLGLGTGHLACNDSCNFDAGNCRPMEGCGNGMVDGNEQCDGADTGDFDCAYFGYRGGMIGCTDTCQLDTSACTSDPDPNDDCGNGVIEPGEECDGDNLGGAYCCGHRGDRPVCNNRCELNYDACVHGQDDHDWNEGQRPLEGEGGDSGDVPNVPATCAQAGPNTGGLLRLLLRR